MGKILKFGIDLGTTNSCIAYNDGKSTKVLQLKNGSRTLPSCVMYDKGEIIVGKKAYEQRFKTHQVIYSTKRDIGTDMIYDIDDGQSKFQVSPVEVSAEILKELKRQAEARFESTITDVYITVPAYFNDRQKKDTLAAGKLAGFNYIRLIAEPSAAAISYTDQVKKPEHVVVYDLGGGTFDVSLLNIYPAVKGSTGGMFGDLIQSASEVATVEVVSIEGNNRLGGDDLDLAILEIIGKTMTKVAKEHYGFYKSFKFLDAISPEYKEKLILWIESLKKQYDGDTLRQFAIPISYEFGTKKLEEVFTLDGAVFAAALKGVFDKTINCFSKVLDRSTQPLDKIILIGGSTKFPMLRTWLSDMYPNTKILYNVSPDYSVALGAAIMSAGDDSVSPVKLFDVVPQNIGIKINRINVGVTQEDVFEPIIMKDASIPGEWSTTVSTESPEQTKASLEVYEGESMFASENAYLGRLVVEGITPKKDKPTAIFVTLKVDINGLLKIIARLDDRTEEIQLINVIRNSNGVEVKNLSQKKYLRFQKLVDRFEEELTAKDRVVLIKQSIRFEEDEGFNEDYLLLIERLQDLSMEGDARVRAATLAEGADLQKQAEEAERTADTYTPVGKIVTDARGKVINIEGKITKDIINRAVEDTSAFADESEPEEAAEDADVTVK